MCTQDASVFHGTIFDSFGQTIDLAMRQSVFGKGSAKVLLNANVRPQRRFFVFPRALCIDDGSSFLGVHLMAGGQGVAAQPGLHNTQRLRGIEPMVKPPEARWTRQEIEGALTSAHRAYQVFVKGVGGRTLLHG